VAHLLGLEHECRDPDCGKDNDNGHSEPTVSAALLAGGDLDGDEETSRQTYKDDANLRDQQSTGRKRAARWYPLEDSKLCEWAMKTNCGGGSKPITGCAANLQQARHHGPDKNTLNNEAGNVHRICHTCHNRWHTLNDEGYVWDSLHEPHNCKPATVEDITNSEAFWQGRKTVTAKD
jgi:hypothetical protein